MQKYSLLKALLPLIESYEEEYKNADLKEFSVYLKNQVWDYEAEKEIKVDDKIYKNFKAFPEVEFATLLTGLYRFVKFYLKQTFKNRKFKSIDEFGFLAQIFQEGNILKNKLISRHLLEISSGSEIIKRLIKHNLVFEYPDKYDKRAKRVELTDLGQTEIIAAFEDMFEVSKLIIGNLNQKEFYSALEVLNKLNLFHWHLLETEKDNSVENLLEKYVDLIK